MASYFFFQSCVWGPTVCWLLPGGRPCAGPRHVQVRAGPQACIQGDKGSCVEQKTGGGPRCCDTAASVRFKSAGGRLSWWSSDRECTFQCKGLAFDPWSKN